MAKANVFDIQRSSFVDGPGIRTVIFFKGCNLHCQWCHNPESWQNKPQQAWFENRCVHCGKCRLVCPAKAIDEKYVTDTSLCIKCGRCINECPAAARKLYGYVQETAEILPTLLADQEFFEVSGGGVTFSGGECLLQVEALEELLRGCKDAGIHTAVDTAGNVPWSTIERVLPYVDLFLYDIKCVSPQLHLDLTRVSNVMILDNYRHLHQIAQQKLMVRIPVIPKANTCGDEMEKIAEYLAIYQPLSVELLPYHKLGVPKSRALGETMIDFEEPNEEFLEELRDLFSSKHLTLL